jgi:hypothetical protein
VLPDGVIRAEKFKFRIGSKIVSDEWLTVGKEVLGYMRVLSHLLSHHVPNENHEKPKYLSS